MYKQILVGYDGSKGGKAALAAGAELADKLEGHVTAFMGARAAPAAFGFARRIRGGI